MSERPAPRLRTVDRQQIIPAMPLEDLLDTDHQARVVWDFCLGLDLTALYDQIRSRVGGPGHPAPFHGREAMEEIRSCARLRPEVAFVPRVSFITPELIRR